MSNPSFSPGSGGGALRGAVDLSSLGQTPPPSTGAAPSGALRVDGTEADFQELVLATRDVAALFVLWSAAHPESEQAVEQAVAAASTVEGRLRVVAVDVDANPGIAAAFQVQQLPMTIGVIAGQPVPLFAGVQPAPALSPVITEILSVAAQNGVTGRIDGAGAGGGGIDDEVAALPPLHQEAFEAIERGDYVAAREAYSKALAANPADHDASAGLAQVGLLERLGGVDIAAARKAAADGPDDVAAQLTIADLDVAGGHIEDAFARLVDLVRRTTEDERDKVRTHLLELFEVVGTHDPRVTKARRALMSALF
ncbi:MAG: tetratricopeptide repeat protein [Dermatophilus congolensis]|nr:tetratricopeptide repeat protein [Dermatophilus congolensis]